MQKSMFRIKSLDAHEKRWRSTKDYPHKKSRNHCKIVWRIFLYNLKITNTLIRCNIGKPAKYYLASHPIPADLSSKSLYFFQ